MRKKRAKWFRVFVLAITFVSLGIFYKGFKEVEIETGILSIANRKIETSKWVVKTAIVYKKKKNIPVIIKAAEAAEKIIQQKIDKKIDIVILNKVSLDDYLKRARIGKGESKYRVTKFSVEGVQNLLQKTKVEQPSPSFLRGSCYFYGRYCAPQKDYQEDFIREYVQAINDHKNGSSFFKFYEAMQSGKDEFILTDTFPLADHILLLNFFTYRDGSIWRLYYPKPYISLADILDAKFSDKEKVGMGSWLIASTLAVSLFHVDHYALKDKADGCLAILSSDMKKSYAKAMKQSRCQEDIENAKKGELNLLGRSSLAEGQFGKAQKYFEKLKTLDNYMGTQGIADIAIRQKKWEKAIQRYESYLSELEGNRKKIPKKDYENKKYLIQNELNWLRRKQNEQ